MDKTLDAIFKAYDIRGKVESELTPELIEKVGYSFGMWLPEAGSVAVGRDMRPDSEALVNALTKGLVAAGRNVINVGQITSDMIYFATGHLKLAGGAVVTASHNPGDYNGIKFCREDAKPISQDTGLIEIRDAAKKVPSISKPENPNVTEKDVTEDWISHVLTFIDSEKLRPLKIAVDAGNGMAGKIFPELEPHLPFEVHEMYFELDGTFPNHIANPLEEKNLVDIKKVIREHQLDVGVAFDGDGDRAVLIDENGEALSGTVMTALLSEYFLAKNPGATIICNAICGQAATETIKNAGGKPVRMRVGHSFIKDGMRTHNAVFAGEHSGHYYFKENYMADSGLLAAVIALAILSDSGKKLSELVAPYRKMFVAIQETNFVIDDKQQVLDVLAQKFTDYDSDWLDGLTVRFDGGWFNVRPSNTEPLLRLNAEARDKTTLDAMVTKVTEVIKS